MLEKLKKRNGFTLIELMVVIVIIGVLALYGLRVYLTQQEKAKNSLVKANASTVQTHIQSELVTKNINEINEDILDLLVDNAGIYNPYNNVRQITSYYSTPNKSTDLVTGMVYVWKDNSNIFHINGWGAEGDDVFLSDLTARR